MKYLVFLLSLLVLTSCSSSEVPANRLVERNGIKYQVNSEEPFTGSAVEFYKNGQLKSRANWKEGEADGLIELFYENGQLNVRANWKDGEQDGLLELFYENGELERTENWKDGVKIDSK